MRPHNRARSLQAVYVKLPYRNGKPEVPRVIKQARHLDMRNERKSEPTKRRKANESLRTRNKREPDYSEMDSLQHKALGSHPCRSLRNFELARLRVLEKEKETQSQQRDAHLQ
ncbi:hypothetical protein C5167_042539 [Papaver somniferum]|uniref:Uncharacterized protein n=1 Tax=Papaver somniferum TaxID=3469 RepID=A0A4Y7L338_PAPSO|nr:hypothetical protein C5167_042539 [Papaver somniferum]